MELLLATGNAHKLDELQAMLGPDAGLALVLPPAPLEVEETGETFAANALLKARAYAAAFGRPCLADDSGLSVDALGGEPGVRSARYAPTDAARIAKLLAALDGVPAPARTAAFHCALAIAWPDGRMLVVEGRRAGRIAAAPRGGNGFGYDPVFWVPEVEKTFAELAPDEKNRLSHRALAVEALRAALARA